jgi:hypothetical protein
LARRNANYFKYGTSSPQGTLWAQVRESAQWVLDQLKIGASSGRQEAAHQAQRGADSVKEGVHSASHGAEEAAERATDYVKEEL